MREVTRLLISYGEGNQEALEQLLPQVYQQLRQLAQSYMRKEHSGHTLQATALVHEAYFRLIDQKAVHWENRAQFFAIAARLMRRILIDHTRNRKADKRGGSQAKISFDEALHWSEQEGPDLLVLDRALEKLSLIDKRQSEVVELRYFGGLNIDETAKVLNTSPATVKRDWTMAKVWLYRELNSEHDA